jgi:hypothetical protein
MAGAVLLDLDKPLLHFFGPKPFPQMMDFRTLPGMSCEEFLYLVKGQIRTRGGSTD